PARSDASLPHRARHGLERDRRPAAHRRGPADAERRAGRALAGAARACASSAGGERRRLRAARRGARRVVAEPGAGGGVSSIGDRATSHAGVGAADGVRLPALERAARAATLALRGGGDTARVAALCAALRPRRMLVVGADAAPDTALLV